MSRDLLWVKRGAVAPMKALGDWSVGVFPARAVTDVLMKWVSQVQRMLLWEGVFPHRWPALRRQGAQPSPKLEFPDS